MSTSLCTTHMNTVRYSFNSLPPKEEYLAKVRRVMRNGVSLSESEMIEATGLTKTQLLCAVQFLLKEGALVRNSSTKKYSQIEIS